MASIDTLMLSDAVESLLDEQGDRSGEEDRMQNVRKGVVQRHIIWENIEKGSKATGYHLLLLCPDGRLVRIPVI